MKIIYLSSDAPVEIDDEDEWKTIATLEISDLATGREARKLFFSVEQALTGLCILSVRCELGEGTKKYVYGGYITKFNEIFHKMSLLAMQLGFPESYSHKLMQSLPVKTLHVKDCNSECLIIDFDGSLKIPAKHLIFVKVDNNPNTTRINGEEWLELTEVQKEEFTIEDLGQALHDSIEHSYERIQVIER
jgi:hypothetical protein